MSYRGNPALDPEMQERIEHTFSETRGLIREGKLQQAVLGCEFILKMDPAYAPAQTLLERLQAHMTEQQAPAAAPAPAEPQAKSGRATQEIPVMPAAAPPPAVAPPAQAAPAPPAELSPAPVSELEPLDDLAPLDDLTDLDAIQLEDDETLPAPGIGLPTAAVTPPSVEASAALGSQLQDLFAGRKYEEILRLAKTRQEAIQSDSQLLALVEQARERHESEAFVQTFLDSARKTRDSGDLAQARTLLEKAQALDGGHPDVVALAAELTAPEKTSRSVNLGSGELVFAAPEGQEEPAPVLENEPLGELPSIDPAADFAGDDLQLPSSVDLTDDLPDAAALTAAEVATEVGEVPEVVDFNAPSPAVESDLDAAVNFAQSEDGELRVDQLLEQGQQAYDRGAYQEAIDIWSRIFLVDLDHQEASDQIEKARNKKAELERQAEEAFHESVGMIERQELDAAKAQLARVLELHPNHHLAREYFEQLEQGKVPTVSSVTALKDPAAGAAVDPTDLDLPELIGGPTEDSPSLEAAVERDRIVAVKKKDWRLIGIAAGLVLAVLVGGYFIASNWSNFFPNAETAEATTGSRPRVDLMARATAMHEGGNTENAINLLQRVPPEDDGYEESQELLAQWAATLGPVDEELDSVAAEQLQAQVAELLDEAHQAFARGRLLRARDAFDRAGRLAPLSAKDLAKRRDVEEQLKPLENELAMFAEKRYRDVIPQLWRIRDKTPGNPDVQQLLVDSYYNLAVRNLRRGNPQEAKKMLVDALEVEPGNEELQRLELFASAYAETPQDLLYRIYVKYLS